MGLDYRQWVLSRAAVVLVRLTSVLSDETAWWTRWVGVVGNFHLAHIQVSFDDFPIISRNINRAISSRIFLAGLLRVCRVVEKIGYHFFISMMKYL